MSAKFDDAIVVDGLVIARFSRAIFEDIMKGGITAANCTCSVWHDFRATMANIAQWKRWFAEHDDLIIQVYTAEDIRRAKSEGVLLRPLELLCLHPLRVYVLLLHRTL